MISLSAPRVASAQPDTPTRCARIVRQAEKTTSAAPSVTRKSFKSTSGVPLATSNSASLVAASAENED